MPNVKKSEVSEQIMDCLAAIYAERKGALCAIAGEALLHNAPETRGAYDQIFIEMNRKMFQLVQGDFLKVMAQRYPQAAVLAADEELKEEEALSAERLYAIAFRALTGERAGMKGRLMARQLQDVAIKDVLFDICREEGEKIESDRT